MRRPRTRDERASAMLLVPTGILIVLILASITVDAALGFMAERTAASIASAAANDAASLAFDTEHFRNTGQYRISSDIEAATDIVTAAAVIQAGDLFIDGTLQVRVTVLDESRVQVVVTGEVARLILPSFATGSFNIDATAIGTVDISP